jgi:hypothetical protein
MDQKIIMASGCGFVEFGHIAASVVPLRFGWYLGSPLYDLHHFMAAQRGTIQADSSSTKHSHMHIEQYHCAA